MVSEWSTFKVNIIKYHGQILLPAVFSLVKSLLFLVPEHNHQYKTPDIKSMIKRESLTAATFLQTHLLVHVNVVTDSHKHSSDPEAELYQLNRGRRVFPSNLNRECRDRLGQFLFAVCSDRSINNNSAETKMMTAPSASTHIPDPAHCCFAVCVVKGSTTMVTSLR